MAVPQPEPLFFQGAAGPVFALYLPARGPARQTFVYLPPFAEEMNRCRATAAQQARALSEQGIATLLVDPYGTGDSSGNLDQATWDIWVQDALTATDWLAQRTQAPVGLWGFRLGALLAADAANRAPGRFNRLLLWQPVQDGKLFFTQYLRLRVAFLMDRNLPPETTDEMRAALAAGQTLEVAGYPIAGPLARDLDGVKLAQFTQLAGLTVDWCEQVSEADKPLTPASQKGIKQLTEQGCTVTAIPFIGPPIWQLHKRDDVPELVRLTSVRMQEGA
ncbi:MAG: hydrolase 2, exosortase A system-associated [Pseudomonadota bacterium]